MFPSIYAISRLDSVVFKAGEVNLWYGYNDLEINRLPEMIRKGQKKTKFTERNTRFAHLIYWITENRNNN